MSCPDCALLVALLALLLDRIVGDPPWLWSRLPHPVALAGAAIDRLERALNRPDWNFGARRAAGVAALVLLVAAAAGLGAAVARALPDRLPGLMAEAAIASVLLAQKSLLDHVRAVAEALAGEGLDGARRAVAMIVGRDVSALDRAGIARAAVESAAENFSDGLVAPAFWLAVLGLPGLFVYKVVNTADSMIGHRSERFRAFGWAAARLDDLLNLAPARLSALLLAGAAAALRLQWRTALAAAWRDAPRHKSPNAGWPEAAAAGALGLRLGGPRRYGAEAVDGTWLNPAGRATADAADIRAALRLIDAAWATLVALCGASLLASAL